MSGTSSARSVRKYASEGVVATVVEAVEPDDKVRLEG